MSTFIAFLRAVNVGKRAYPMAELREVLTEAGFTDVATHIQTGNVRVGTTMRSRAKVVAALEKAMLTDRGFDVPVVLLTPAELAEVYAEAQDVAAEVSKDSTVTGHYLALLAKPPSASVLAQLEARSKEGETVRVGRRVVHLLLDKAFHESSTGNAEVERHAGVATTRSLSVITKLVEKWGP